MIESVPRRRDSFARFGQRHHVAVDMLVAAITASWIGLSATSLELGREAPLFGPAAVTLFFCILLVVAVALAVFRRRRPVLTVVIVFCATLPLALVDPSLGNLAVGFAAFALAVYESVRLAWIAAAVSAGLTVALCALHVLVGIPTWDTPGTDRLDLAVSTALLGALFLLASVSLGQNARGRKRYIDDLIGYARQIERERDQQVQLAALAERSRIARDMHDIVAHSLSVVVRLADGATAVFDQEPQRARGAIEQLAGVARTSLTDMRRVIGMFEPTPDATPVQTGVGFDDLERLVDVYRGIGLPISFDRQGAGEPEVGVQMTVFRVMQEALTNVLRHAAAPSEVSVRIVSDRQVTVRIRNDGVVRDLSQNGHVGRGVVGMQERASLYGGTLTAGPAGDGQWLVSMTIPGLGR